MHTNEKLLLDTYISLNEHSIRTNRKIMIQSCFRLAIAYLRAYFTVSFNQSMRLYSKMCFSNIIIVIFILINHLGKLYVVVERQNIFSTSLFVFLSPLFYSEINFMSIKKYIGAPPYRLHVTKHMLNMNSILLKIDNIETKP